VWRARVVLVEFANPPDDPLSGDDRRAVGNLQLETQQRADGLGFAARDEHAAAAHVRRELFDERGEVGIAELDPQRNRHAPIRSLVCSSHREP